MVRLESQFDIQLKRFEVYKSVLSLLSRAKNKDKYLVAMLSKYKIDDDKPK